LGQVQSYGQNIAQLQRQIDRLRLKGGAEEVPVARKHPFVIYKSPPASDPSSLPPGFDPPENTPEAIAAWRSSHEWRIFRVRAGKVGVTDVLGTDGEGEAKHPAYAVPVSPDVDPDKCGVPAFDSDIEFLVTSGEVWSVWIDCTDMDEPEVNSSATAPAAGWGANYVWLGTVDCQAGLEKKIAIVRQVRRQDIPVATACVNGIERLIPI